jgi:hypothetical protein
MGGFGKYGQDPGRANRGAGPAAVAAAGVDDGPFVDDDDLDGFGAYVDAGRYHRVIFRGNIRVN